MSPDVKRKGAARLSRSWRVPAALRSRAAHLAPWVMIAALLANIIASVLPASLLGPGIATAASSLDSAQADLKKAKADLRTEQARLDKYAQRQSDAETLLETTKMQIAAVQAKTDKAQADLAKSKTQLAGRLAEIYKNRESGALGVLGAVLTDDDTSITAVIERLVMVTHVAQNDSQLIANVRDALAQLNQLAAELTAKKTAEQQQTAQLAAATQATMQAMEASKGTYAQLQARVATLQAEELKRQEEARKAEAARVAAAQAAAAKAAAAKAASAKTADSGSSATNSSGSTSTTKAKSTTTSGSSGGNSKPPDPVVDTSAGWVFPVQGPNSFVDDFGAPRSGGRKHKGNDILTARNTPLVAVVNGVIRSTTPTNVGLGGITIFLKGDDGNTYYYAHLSSIKSGIKPGVRVKAGQVIGYAGNTGNAAGGPVHLHFEIHPGGGAAIDPYPTLMKYR